MNGSVVKDVSKNTKKNQNIKKRKGLAVIKMEFKELYDKVKHNHGLMMVICCGIPLILLVIGCVLFEKLFLVYKVLFLVFTSVLVIGLYDVLQNSMGSKKNQLIMVTLGTILLYVIRFFYRVLVSVLVFSHKKQSPVQ